MIFMDADGTIRKRNPISLALEKIAKEYDKKGWESVYSSLVAAQRILLMKGEYLRAYDRRRIVASKLGEERSERLSELVKEFASSVDPIPQALELMDSEDVVVISNGYREFIEAPLKAIGARYRSLVTPDEVLKDELFKPRAPPIKPFRPIFVRAMIKAGVPRAMIGDHYVMDGIGAVRAGIPKAFVLNPYTGLGLSINEEALADGPIDIERYKHRVRVASWDEILKELL